MTFTIYYSLLIAIIGGVIFVLASDAKVKTKELARILFAAGMFAFCFQLGQREVSGSTPGGSEQHTIRTR